MAGLAKKRAPVRSNARSGRGKSSGMQMPAWKKSWLLAVVLLFVIAYCLHMMITNFKGNSGVGLPDTFPRSFIALEDAGNYDALLIIRGSDSPVVPIEKNGKKYYEAYICNNENCPGRSKTDGKPYIFGIVPPPPPPQYVEGTPPPQEAMPEFSYGMLELYCPLCKEKFDSVKPKYQARYEPYRIERYNTPEALEMIEKVRAEFMKKNQ